MIRQTMESSFYDSLVHLMQGVELIEMQECICCGQCCPTWDCLTSPSLDGIVGVVAGTCCYDLIILNRRKHKNSKVVNSSTIAWVVYAYIMQKRQPD